jgi:Carboxypeptidase regulatory-like domain/TonB-dependent Receptor Plug Domain
MPRSSQQDCCVYTAVVSHLLPPLSINPDHLLRLVFCLLLSAFCLTTSSYAQSATATLSVTVEDQKGAMVPGASLVLINKDQGTQRLATTNNEGAFIFPLLPPGRYSLTATATGFAPVEINGVVLNVNDQSVLKIQLKIGTVTQSVEIVDGASLINESPAVGTVVDRQFVENMPLNGRSFQTLIELTPGTVLTKTSSSGEQGQFSVNGQRSNANYFTIDGVGANIGVNAVASSIQATGGTLPGFSASGGTNNLVSVDALQEFKVQTSTYAPEFGRTPGAQVQILTRSGTNRFSGVLFEYFRNDVFDANDWFNNQLGLRKAAMRQNNFGGVLGGPIVKNRTFFFFSYEGLRLRQPRTAITDVPSVTVRQTAVPAMKDFLNAFPMPNGPNRINPMTGLPNGLAQFSASFSDPSTLNATSIRVDHTVGSKLTLFGRYNYAPSSVDQRVAFGTLSVNSRQLTALNTQTLTGGATWIITSNITNEIRANWSQNRMNNSVQVDDFGGAIVPPDVLLFPSSTSREDSTYFFLSSGRNTQFQVGTPAEHLQRQVNLVDNLSIGAGSHQLKFGVDYRRLFPILGTRKYSQTASFVDINQAAAGKAFLVSISSDAGLRFPIYHNFSAYGQDAWKMTRKLTLTYGLRWEVNSPPREKNGKHPAVVTGLDNPATLALAPFGTPLYKTTYNNFAPRIGVAYQLFQTPGRETVLRGGFGTFYDLGSNQTGGAFTSVFPYVGSRRVSIPGGVPYPLDPALAVPPPISATPQGSRIFAFDPNLKLPRTYQWNFAIEQSLSANQTISAAYVAAVGRRLLRQETLSSPNASFLQVFVTRNGATSDYHGMQLQYDRRLSRGLHALASYAWSKSLDSTSGDSFLNVRSDRIDPSADRGPSDFDVRHLFSAAVTYNFATPKMSPVGKAILRDWAIDTMFRARSATPLNVIVSGVTLFGAGNTTRPDLVSGVPLYLHDPNVAGGRRINRSAFISPPIDPATRVALRQGTLGRNALRGFPIHQIDFALRRKFSLTERVNLQFRAEAFNLFNHPNFGFGESDTDINNSLFGQSTTMLGRSLGGAGGVGFNPLYQIGGPRSLQFALRLQF